MKKLLLSVASLAALVGSAQAGPFGLFTGCHGCQKCGGLITLRQYNAFSPAACGSMTFSGCVVQPPAPAGMAYQAAPPGYGYGDAGCTDGSCGGEGVQVGQLQSAPAYGPYAAYAQGANYGYNPVLAMQQMQYIQYLQQVQATQQMQAMQQMQQMQQMPVLQQTGR